MPLTRKEHWDTRAFHDFLQARAKLPFAWGTNDCALFAADAVLAITGTDIAADFRGKYTDEASAFALIKTVTARGTDPATAVGDAAEWCANHAGLIERVYPLMAQRGDLVVMENGGQTIAGVIHLNGRHAISVSEAGLVRLSIRSVTRAWAV
jgi:hypothetical protein